MREEDIRAAVIDGVRSEHPDEADTRIVEEMGLAWGDCRADVAVINGKLIGIEIKSHADSLTRLPRQVELYGQVFDEVTLVAARRHLAPADAIIPAWWGVTCAGEQLEVVRGAAPNPSVDAAAVLRLLWRDELGQVAAAAGLKRLTRSTRADLVGELAVVLALDEIRDKVRDALKAREGWRPPRPPG